MPRRRGGAEIFCNVEVDHIEQTSDGSWTVFCATTDPAIKPAKTFTVRAENLVLLREHRSTIEPAMASEARRLLSATHADAAATSL